MDTKNSGFTSKLVHAGSVPDSLGSAVLLVLEMLIMVLVVFQVKKKDISIHELVIQILKNLK